jgi:hypothetical protein
MLGFGPVEDLQYQHLSDHFYEAFFYNDLISSKDDPQLTIGNILAILTFFGLAVSMYLFPKYYYYLASAPESRLMMEMWMDKCFYAAFTMIILGLVMILEWESLFPDRRDYMILNVLPITHRALFVAKASALAKFAGIFFVMSNLFGAIIFPLAAAPKHASILFGAWFVLTNALTLTLASAFVVFAFVAAQGLLLTVLSYRFFIRISPWLQLGALFALFSMLLLLPSVGAKFKQGIGNHPETLLNYPPFWFVGISETLNGSAPGIFRQLSLYALGSLAAVAFLAVAMYAIAYRRHLRTVLESTEPDARPMPRGFDWAGAKFNDIFLPHPFQRAGFYFVLRTLARSAKHRLFLAAFLGVGFSLVLAQRLATAGFADASAGSMPPMHWLTLPLVLSFFALVGMRTAFLVPAELPANWIFQFHHAHALSVCLAGVRKAMLLTGAIPPAALILPVTIYQWGWTVGVFQTTYTVLMSWALIEVLLIKFPKIPFTCSYLPRGANVIFLWTAYWFVFATYAYTLAGFESWLLASPLRQAVFLLFSAGIIYAWRRNRDEVLRLHQPPIFEEIAPPLVQRLGLTP